MATQVSDTSSKSRLRGSSSDELAVIAQRAQAFTNASGTAIALSEGNTDEIVCRARSGSTAPDVGATLRVQGTFTGLCIQSGKELRCDDAETDTRVDTAAIRALGIRSMVVIPVKDEGRIVGVLAVFAPTAHAFTITHVAVLKTMGDQISAFLQKERRAHDEGFDIEPVRPPVSQVVPKAAAPVIPPAIVVKPAAPAPSSPTSFVSRSSLPVVSKVEPVITAVAEEVTPVVVPAKKEKREERRIEPREPRPEYRPSFSTLDAAAAPGKRPGMNLMILGLAAVVALVAGGVFVYQKVHKPPVPATQVQENSNPSSNAVNTSAVPTPTAPIVSNAPAAPPPTIASTEPAPAPVESARKAEKPSAKAAAPAPAAPPQKREETVALSAGTSRIASATNSGTQAQDAAPALAIGGTPAAGAISSLANPVTSSTPSMLTQSELQSIQVIRKVAPVYPLVAKQRMLSGTVVIQGTVGTDGKITNLQLVSGSPIFREAAFDAVKQWQFKPARLNGQPIEQSTQIQLVFAPR